MGTRYIADQNKVVMLYESGTYANTSGTGQWVGEVTENTFTDDEGYLTDIFLGDSSRSIGRFERGPNDVTGTITYHPVDMNLVAHTIGSVTEESGATFSHLAVEIGADKVQNPFTSGTTNDLNTPYSFTLEDSKQAPGTGLNFIRTAKGCAVTSLTINAAQGEKVSIDANWLGQGVDFSSGATTAVTVADQAPYLWSDCLLTVAGSDLTSSKSVSIEINQNVEGPHYLNGSRVIGEPFFGNREYTTTVTADLKTDMAQMLYNQYYKGGSTLNYVFDMNADTTGSQHATFTVSGARITEMELPSPAEGINETTFTMSAGSMDMVDYVNPGFIGSYNPF